MTSGYGKGGRQTAFLTAFEVSSLATAGFFFRDNFLPIQVANQIRSEALGMVARGDLRTAGFGREGETDVSVRGDSLCWMEKSSAGKGSRALMVAFEKLRQTMNREFFLGIARYEMQLAHYSSKSLGYKRHLDSFRGGPNRRLTAIFYLNPSWRQGDGGELALYLASGELLVQPLQNRLLVFLAEDVEHAVLPVEASRLALTAWFHGS